VQESSAVRAEVAGAIGTVVLDRPGRKNALGLADWDALREICESLGRDPAVRVVVVKGAGGDFSAGADLSAPWPAEVPASEAMRRIAQAALSLWHLPKPTIARVEGVAYGAGLNLALACDLAVVAVDARLSEVFVRRGLAVDFGGSWLLPRLVGMAKAKRLALLGSEVRGRDAAEMGLVTEAVPASELDLVVERWVGELSGTSRLALALTKQLLQDGATATFQAALDAECRAQVEAIGGPDANEALSAFLEHRPPRFS